MLEAKYIPYVPNRRLRVGVDDKILRGAIIYVPNQLVVFCQADWQEDGPVTVGIEDYTNAPEVLEAIKTVLEVEEIRDPKYDLCSNARDIDLTPTFYVMFEEGLRYREVEKEFRRIAARTVSSTIESKL